MKYIIDKNNSIIKITKIEFGILKDKYRIIINNYGLLKIINSFDSFELALCFVNKTNNHRNRISKNKKKATRRIKRKYNIIKKDKVKIKRLTKAQKWEIRSRESIHTISMKYR